MIPETIGKTTISNNGMTRERILVDIPQSDLMLFRLFADKFGWQFKRSQPLWEDFIKSRPQNVDLTDDEIMEEVIAVRYAKVQDSH